MITVLDLQVVAVPDFHNVFIFENLSILFCLNSTYYQLANFNANFLLKFHSLIKSFFHNFSS